MPDIEYELVHMFAGLPRTVRGRPITLHADPKGKTFLYCNGNSIYIRDLENPSVCDIYTQHAKDTTVAAYAPSGFYICSADITGKIRIWDTTNKEHILKYEYQVLGGAIKDISWDAESKRIAVCGDGRETSANVISWDTGTSVGQLSGPSGKCNNVHIKQNRPYRLILASEDYSAYYYEGPPFKYKSMLSNHTNFVNCCRYSPDGSRFATAGADGRCFIHDGKTGELLGELCEAAGKIHKGGIYGISWSPDGQKLMTCSADKTVKIWNMDERYYISNKETQGDDGTALHCVFNMGTAIDDMQVGCLWSGNNLLSVSLSGCVNYLDMDNPSSPKKIIKGHNKSIISSCLTEDKGTLFTASFSGLICYWDLSTGIAEVVEGKGHTNQVTQMTVSGDTLLTCGMDDTVRFISIADKKYKDDVIKLDSQPQGISAGNMGFSVVACLNNEVIVIQDTKVTHKYKVKYEPASVAVNSSLGKVLVGTDAASAKVIVYDIEGDQLKETSTFPCNGNVTDIKFSPDNQYVAIASGKKQVKIVCTSDFKTEQANWGSHAGKVNAVAWTPNSQHLASCGIDGAVYTYDVCKPCRQADIRGAHSQSVDVTSIQWSDDNTLITSGRQDCSLKVWQIRH